MRKLQVLVVLLALVGGALLVLDVLVREQAEVALAATVEQQAPGTQGASAEIAAFPFVGRVLVGSDVPSITVRAARAKAGELVLTDVVVTAREVVVDTDAAVRGEARLRSIGSGSLSASITPAALSDRLDGLEVVLRPGRAEVQGPGGLKGEIVAQDGQLVLRVPRRGPVTVPLDKAGILPCRPDVEILEGALALSCTFTDVPQSFLNVVQSADGRRSQSVRPAPSQ